MKELLAMITGEVLKDSPIRSTETSLDFRMLTALSGDNSGTAPAIIQAFTKETGRNRGRMEESVRIMDVDGMTGMAHKLLLLFTLLGASGAFPSLSWLEQHHGEAISDEIARKAREALQQVDIVLTEARRYAPKDQSR